MSCPACGSESPGRGRFCPACGFRMTGHGEERRVVTVLFADLVGFTTLAETLDPEQVKNLVDRCFERLVADITALRRPGRQDHRRRDRGPVRRAGRPRGRRRAGRARRAAHAGDARRPGRRAVGAPRADAHRRQHRRGARRRAPGRRRLHGHGRRREHRQPPADRGRAGRGARRRGHLRRPPHGSSATSRAGWSRPRAGRSRSRRGSAIEPLLPPGVPAPARRGAARRARRRAGAAPPRSVDTALDHAPGPVRCCSSATPAWARPASPRRSAARPSATTARSCSRAAACPTARPTCGGRSPRRSASACGVEPPTPLDEAPSARPRDRWPSALGLPRPTRPRSRGSPAACSHLSATRTRRATSTPTGPARRPSGPSSPSSRRCARDQPVVIAAVRPPLGRRRSCSTCSTACSSACARRPVRARGHRPPGARSSAGSRPSGRHNTVVAQPRPARPTRPPAELLDILVRPAARCPTRSAPRCSSAAAATRSSSRSSWRCSTGAARSRPARSPTAESLAPRCPTPCAASWRPASTRLGPDRARPSSRTPRCSGAAARVERLSEMADAACATAPTSTRRWPSWPRRTSSSSTTATGCSAPTSSARSPTTRSPSSTGPSATPGSPSGSSSHHEGRLVRRAGRRRWRTTTAWPPSCSPTWGRSTSSRAASAPTRCTGSTRPPRRAEKLRLLPAVERLCTQALLLSGPEPSPHPPRSAAAAGAGARLELRESWAAEADAAEADEVATLLDDPRGRASVLLVRGDLQQKAGELAAALLTLDAAVTAVRGAGRRRGPRRGLAPPVPSPSSSPGGSRRPSARHSRRSPSFRSLGRRRGRGVGAAEPGVGRVRAGAVPTRPDHYVDSSLAAFARPRRRRRAGLGPGAPGLPALPAGPTPTTPRRCGEQMLAEAAGPRRPLGDRHDAAPRRRHAAVDRAAPTRPSSTARRGCALFQSLHDGFGQARDRLAARPGAGHVGPGRRGLRACSTRRRGRPPSSSPAEDGGVIGGGAGLAPRCTSGRPEPAAGGARVAVATTSVDHGDGPDELDSSRPAWPVLQLGRSRPSVRRAPSTGHDLGGPRPPWASPTWAAAAAGGRGRGRHRSEPASWPQRSLLGDAARRYYDRCLVLVAQGLAAARSGDRDGVRRSFAHPARRDRRTRATCSRRRSPASPRAVPLDLIGSSDAIDVAAEALEPHAPARRRRHRVDHRLRPAARHRGHRLRPRLTRADADGVRGARAVLESAAAA